VREVTSLSSTPSVSDRPTIFISSQTVSASRALRRSALVLILVLTGGAFCHGMPCHPLPPTAATCAHTAASVDGTGEVADETLHEA
jgi:hypothetical protein